jgi:hypothetical protein
VSFEPCCGDGLEWPRGREACHAERNAALAVIEPGADTPIRITLGADKGDDAEDFVNELRSMNVAAKAKARPSMRARRGTPDKQSKSVSSSAFEEPCG